MNITLEINCSILKSVCMFRPSVMKLMIRLVDIQFSDVIMLPLIVYEYSPQIVTYMHSPGCI